MKQGSKIKNTLVMAICVGLLLSCQSKRVDDRHAGWANITLHVTGFGQIEKGWSIEERIQAIQKAKMDAYAQLESNIMALQADSSMNIAEFSEKDRLLQKKIAAFVRGAKIIRTENSKAGIHVVTELFLGDNFKTTMGLGKKRSRESSSLQRGGDLSR